MLQELFGMPNSLKQCPYLWFVLPILSEGSPELTMTSSYQVVKNTERKADRQPLLKSF